VATVTKFVAIAALVGLVCLMSAELEALRGELAFVRFRQAERASLAVTDPEWATAITRAALADGRLTVSLNRGDPAALWELAGACGRWAGRDDAAPLQRLQLAQLASDAATQAACEAPSDFENWLRLARTQVMLGLQAQARSCFEFARQLAPPGRSLSRAGADAERGGSVSVGRESG